MPDISMCKNEKCTLKDTCYRFSATPNSPYQYYQPFNELDCDSYIPIYE